MLSLNINTIDDSIVELDELVTVTLSNALPDPAGITTSTASATLINNDEATVTMTEPSIQEGDTSTTNLIFSVTLDQAVDVPFTVDYITQVDSADTSDFTNLNQTINFSGTQGETYQITVSILGDLDVELDEALLLQSGNIEAAGRLVTADSGQGTILNDDSSNLAIADATAINEGDSGLTEATFNVTLERATPTGFTVDWTLPSSEDVVGATGTLTFLGQAGEIQPIVINVLGDEVVELDETISVTLSNLSATEGVDLTNSTGDLTILNDDAATVTIIDANTTEGESISFSVNLSHPVDAALTFDVSTDPTTSSDFTLIGGTQVTFEPEGPLMSTLTLFTSQDEVVEDDETFTITLTTAEDNGRVVTLADDTATGTILNDDTSVLSIENISVIEGNSGGIICQNISLRSVGVDTSSKCN